jgi:methyl-accepting chemotaxis protein
MANRWRRRVPPFDPADPTSAPALAATATAALARIAPRAGELSVQVADIAGALDAFHHGLEATSQEAMQLDRGAAQVARSAHEIGEGAERIGHRLAAARTEAGEAQATAAQSGERAERVARACCVYTEAYPELAR